uniref:Uncharacterized protein n=1 Tax=Acyrthosiphon pisum TaxID=7029 RepID=C4WTR3_ACYPI|nr:hypothetical protein [Acyrthosiphon pisum]
MNMLNLFVMLNVIGCTIIYVSGYPGGNSRNTIIPQGSNTNKESVASGSNTITETYNSEIHTELDCQNGLIDDGFMNRNADGSLSCINGWKNKALKDDNYSVYGKLLVKAYTNGNV